MDGMQGEWNHKILNVSDAGFADLALSIFHHQYDNNPIYGTYCTALQVRVSAVNSIEKIPFLPISFFKSHEVRTGSYPAAAVFESSGTTGSVNSRHYVKDTSLYTSSFTRTFQQFYGNISDYCVLGLLPSYLERKNSSLVYMVKELIASSNHPQSGFYLHEHDKLSQVMDDLESKGQSVLLIGVTFALLDFAEKFKKKLKHTIVMETGGMKGRREELVRPAVHDILKDEWGLENIHSEYGMTELLSQAYSKQNGIFECPPWMKILARDEEDPLTVYPATTGTRITGALNVIDLANIHSCAFIATDDAVRVYGDGSFEVLGRLDNSDIRGCSLMSLDV